MREGVPEWLALERWESAARNDATAHKITIERIDSTSAMGEVFSHMITIERSGSEVAP
jgi:hypothetical protein